jgi:hypothetical protein
MVGWSVYGMQSVPITTNVVSSSPVHGKVYSVQHYVIMFVSDLPQVGGFLRVLWFPSPIKHDRHHTSEILLKVALNTIKETNQPTPSLHLKERINSDGQQ